MQALDHEKLQKIQDGIAELAGIYLYCVDADGNAVTKLSGEPKEGERLLRLIGKENIEALYNRLCRSSLEDQIIEDTSYGNVKTAAVTVRKEGRPTMCWLAYCVLEKKFTKRGHYADGFLRVTSESAFMQALDLLRMWLTEEEKEQAKKDMGSMLDYIDKLNELDTEGVEPMSHVFPVQNVFREDVVANGDDRDNMLANAPEKKDGTYMVPKTFD